MVSDDIRCPACGSTLNIDLNGHLEEVSCTSCDWKQWATVYPASEVELIDGATELYEVYIEWKEGISVAEQIATARRTFHEVGEMSSARVFELAKSGAAVKLGTYIKPLAIDRQEEGKKAGLSVVLKRQVPESAGQ